MRLLCPAKINLHLRVGPRRQDGFHSLLSWFTTVGLFDTLILQKREPDRGPRVVLRCDQPEIPCDERNLVVKAAEALARDTGSDRATRLENVQAELHKRIPAGAGLGGGSSDGARALQGLNALWNIVRSAADLSTLAARLGSDLPFFFFGPSSICKGRGEIVQPISRPTPRWVLLFLPPIIMPTAEVYRRFDAMKLGRDSDIQQEPDWSAWSRLDVHDLLCVLVNDLEPPAFAISPALAELRRQFEKSLGRPVRMSGSGSSLFTLFDDADEIERARRMLIEAGPFPDVRLEAVQLAPDFPDDLTH